MDATDAFQHHELDRAALAGLPEAVLERAARARGRAPARRVVATARRADLSVACSRTRSRRRCARGTTRHGSRARRTKARTPGVATTAPLIEEILALRHESRAAARFPRASPRNRWRPRWRDIAGAVFAFLRDLARARGRSPSASSPSSSAFAGRTLEPWDVGLCRAAAQEQLRASEEELRPYFPLPRVIDGLFAIAGGCSADVVERRGASTSGIRTCAITISRRATARSPALLRRSLRARRQARRRVDGRVRRPRAARRRHAAAGRVPGLQLRAADGDDAVAADARRRADAVPRVRPRPASPADRSRLPGVAGINGVEWDAVELPSQFMENFGWQPRGARLIARHYQTGEPLPGRAVDTHAAPRAFPRGPVHGAPARVRAVRFPHASRVRPGARRARARDPRRGAPRGRGDAAAGVAPLSARLHAHLRRRLRGRLLQL